MNDEEKKKETICTDCGTIAQLADTRYTLIGTGWRVTRRATPQGFEVDWRCAPCWREHKARTQTVSGAYPAASRSWALQRKK